MVSYHRPSANVVVVIDSVRRVINTSDYSDNYSTSLCPDERSRRKSHLHSSCYASDDRVNKKGSDIQQAHEMLSKQKRK